MFKTKNKIGSLGEDIACKYLEGRGFEVVQRNYWKPQGEIDIIARKKGITHFVEVKSVTWNFLSASAGSGGIRPEENLHKNKLRRFFRAVQIYLIEKNLGEKDLWQIDAIFVFIDPKLQHS